MSRRVDVVLIDDIDGEAAVETVTFGLDGVSYEIDLSEENAERLRESLAEFVAASRKSGKKRAGRGQAAAASRSQSSEIRAWALENGIEINKRGRISAEIVAQYEAATGS